MSEINRTKEQTMIYKTLHRKLKFERREKTEGAVLLRKN